MTDTARQTFESAMQALNSGDYPAAEAGFNKVLAADPRNVSALANLGVLYAKTHRYGKAIQVYQRALRVSPQLREIQLDLGLAYLKQEDYVHALPYFRRVAHPISFGSSGHDASGHMPHFQRPSRSRPKLVEALNGRGRC